MESNDEKELLIKALDHELKERLADRSIILSRDEREMVVYALRYMDAETAADRDALNRSLKIGWDKDKVMSLIDRLKQLSEFKYRV